MSFDKFGSITITSGSAVRILEANSQRQSVILSNIGSQTVAIGPTSDVAVTDTPLEANGNLTEDNGSMRMYMGEFWGIGATSTNVITYWERVR